MEEVAEEIGDKAVIAKVNVDQGQQVAEQCGVQSIPTRILFKTGEVVQQFVGIQQKKMLINIINQYTDATA